MHSVNFKNLVNSTLNALYKAEYVIGKPFDEHLLVDDCGQTFGTVICKYKT